MLLLSSPFSSFNALPSNLSLLICFYSFSHCPCQLHWINDVILVCLNVYFFLHCPWHRILFPKLIHPESHFSFSSDLPSRPAVKWQLQMAKQMLRMQKLFKVVCLLKPTLQSKIEHLNSQCGQGKTWPSHDTTYCEKGRWLTCWRGSFQTRWGLVRVWKNTTAFTS